MNKLIAIAFPISVLMSCQNSLNNVNSQAADSLQMESTKLKSIVFSGDSVSAEPYLFTDKNGAVFLSWIEKSNGKHWLKFSTLTNNEWSKPDVISSGNNWFINWADYPQIASDGLQNMVAHYLEKSEKGTYTYDVKLVTSSDKGKTWSNSKLLHDDGKKAEHGFVSIIPHEGNYFISWLDGRNATSEGDGGHDSHHGEMTIRAAIVNKDGVKSHEWELDGRVCDCCQTSSTITQNGPIVFYRDRSENEIRDISIVRMVNGMWTKPKSIFSDNWKIEGCPVNGPRSDAQGNNVAVAWFSSPEKKAQVNVMFSDDGGETFNSPIRIDEGKAIGRVDIVMIDTKSGMICWMEGSVIKAARIYKDGTKSQCIIIAASSESRSSGFPQMTKSGDKIIFAWTDDGTKSIKTATLPIDKLHN